MAELFDRPYEWRAGPLPKQSGALPAGLYDCLRRLAAQRLRRERCDHTLQPTALAHEAYLRLIRRHDFHPDSTLDFVAAAVQEIRRVLIDHARGKRRRKRGAGLDRHPLTDSVAAPSAPDPLDLDGAIARLERVAPRAAQTVQLRFFAGLSLTETAALLDVTPRTVERDWQFARAWLYRDLYDNHRRAG